MNGYGALVEWYWQGKTEVLGEKHYTASLVDEWMGMEHWWNDTDRGKRSTGRKTCPSTSVSNINLTWTGLESNPSLKGLKLTNYTCLKKSSPYRAVNTLRLCCKMPSEIISLISSCYRHSWKVFVYIFIVIPEGQAGEAGEPSYRALLFLSSA